MRSHSFSYDDGSFDARRGRRGRFDDEADLPVRRGRLTDHERAALESLRSEETDSLAVPSGADRWSTWGQGELGPEPLPEWVITAEGAVDTVLGVVKTGKEAEVFLVERAVPDSGPGVLLAEKRYRSADHRLFHRDAGGISRAGG